MSLAAQGILPPVVVLPVAALAVLVVAGHLTALRAAPGIPLSRRRLRTASGVVMLVTTVVLAYAFSFVRSDDPGRFTVAWSAAIMLLVVVLGLAGLDALNNVRLARILRRRIRRDAGQLHAQLAAAIALARQTAPDAPRTPDPPDPPDHDEPNLTLRGRQEDP